MKGRGIGLHSEPLYFLTKSCAERANQLMENHKKLDPGV
ncbi:hypothetical protein KR50_20160 [Jeotgalibacillus campisalis]|uniref:Uncharacterized protein n=1 Tax=Jeotgalibacillus campisalis TaxID=220754 RepID=A0A0C2S1C1_9BACL|nr:hypothetical protein KR50_20160 [Jeotgalibacillus campisalis]